MKEWALLVHLIIIFIGCFIFMYDYKKKKNRTLSIFMGSNAIFFFIFGIVPIVMIFNNFFVGKTDFYLIYTINYHNESYLFASLIILIGYITFLSTYLLSNPYKKCYVEYSISKKTLQIFGFITLLISLVSSLFIQISLGGIINSFKYIEIIRSGVSIIPSSIFLLLPISISSFIIYYSLHMEKKQIISFDFFMLIISLYVSIYYIVMFGGRLPFAMFILLLPMYYFDREKKWTIKNIAIIFIVGIFMLNYLENLFDILSKSEYSKRAIVDNIPRLFSQFSFPYINVLKVNEFTYNNGEFRYFIDYISWIINYIPSKIGDIIGLGKIIPSYAINTNHHLMFDPSNPVAGGIPTDIITFGYYQFALPGVIIVSLLFGKFIAYLDKFFNNTQNNIFFSLAKIRIFQVLAFYPMYADVESFMRRRIDVVILITIIVLFKNKRKINENSM